MKKTVIKRRKRVPAAGAAAAGGGSAGEVNGEFAFFLFLFFWRGILWLARDISWADGILFVRADGIFRFFGGGPLDE
jgi:hypothetical protein